MDHPGNRFAKSATGVVALVCALMSTIQPARADKFGDYWHDGKAELDGYRLTVSRYGQERSGTAVMIFVTEPFSEGKRVKVNDAGAKPEDTFDALKLNLVRDFQTGVYDYNTMTSVFVHSSDFSPSKITFSSAEWCGHVYSELLFGARDLRSRYFSYFEDETRDGKIEYPRGGVAEDNLFILLRGLRGEYLKAGGKRSIRLMPSSFSSRLAHKELSWVGAEVSRANRTERVSVPAGSFEVMRYTVKIQDGRTGTFLVESNYPHRIIRWSLSPDVRGELTGSKRLAYWKLNHEGEESYREGLGLR